MASPQLNRRDFLKTAASLSPVLAGAGSTLFSSCATELKRPNILFIMTDDLPNNAMSCYGSTLNITPNLDRIADGGMRFNNAFVTTSLCGPSRASLLTGTYPHVNGQVTIGRLFDTTLPAFPTLLQQSGYETAIIGKWHLWSEPAGFDYWNILLGQGPYFNPQMVENGVVHTYEGYTTDIITDRSLEWLRNRSTDRPFCLMLHHKAPHWIPEPDERHQQMYTDGDLPEPRTFNDTHETRISAREHDWDVATLHESQFFLRHRLWQNLPEDLSSEDRKKDNYQRYMKDMLRAIASVDDNVGRVLDYLDESGLTEDTMVVYTSDNGYFLGEHGWIDKKVVYDESIRIPLLVRYPRSVQPETVNDDFIMNVDFAPTFLDMAGLPAPDVMQGESFKPLLAGNTPADWRYAAYVQYYLLDRFPYYAIRTRQYKLAYFYDKGIADWELYDFAKDPDELTNVYRDPAYADVIADLKSQLEHIRADLNITPELEMDIYENSPTDQWSKEINEYTDRKMAEWGGNR